MNKEVTIYQPVNGISINDELEQLLDKKGEPIVFPNKNDAMNFLKANNVDTDFIYCAPELCEGCKQAHIETISEREERFNFDKGDCPGYDMEMGGRE